MTYSSNLIENESAAKFATQLEADLATGVRGGNKFRLIARCWVATNYGANCGLDSNDYDRFRNEWSRQTFAKIHQAFDQVLPQQFRSQENQSPAHRRYKRQASGMTDAQQLKFERFCKSPARLEKRFNKSADYFLSCGSTDHLLATAKRYQEAAEYCKSLIGDTVTLTAMWNTGIRTGGDLESQVERSMKI